ncbi:MAG: YigZ family protein [Eubacteriaceae bacterium]|nr:YigZ family protein [Eubacteriaceae bacterium]
MEYYTVFTPATAEYEIKKSRFIARIEHITSPRQASDICAGLKKEHYKANHVCYAYILGENAREKKFSDAGEPAGTAGKPILGVLEANGLTDVLASVVRYFGGIKLGASGLTRAYSTAIANSVNSCEIVKMILCRKISVEADYSDYEKVRQMVSSFSATEVISDFAHKVNINAAIPEDCEEKLLAALREITGGKFGFSRYETQFVKETKSQKTSIS